MMEHAQEQDKRWSVDDAELLDEIDELILHRLTELEAAGVVADQLARWVSYYGDVYDIIYAGLLGRRSEKVTDNFKEEVWEFLAESYWTRIENIYDPELNLSEDKVNEIVGKTRSKLRRLEDALFRH